MKNVHTWNFRPTLDRLEVFLLFDTLIAIAYFGNHGSLDEPEMATLVLTLLLVINTPLLLLFSVNLTLELLRKCGVMVEWPDVTVWTGLLLMVEWYVFVGGFAVSITFQTNVLLVMAGTLFCYLLCLYCLNYERKIR